MSDPKDMVKEVPEITADGKKSTTKLMVCLFLLFILLVIAVMWASGFRFRNHVNVGWVNNLGARSEVAMEDKATVVAVHDTWSAPLHKRIRGHVRMTLTPIDAVVLIQTPRGPIPIDDGKIILPYDVETFSFMIDPNETRYEKVWVKCELLRRKS